MIYAVWLEDEDNKRNVAAGECKRQESNAKSAKIQHDAAWKLFEYALKKERGIELSECTVQYNRFGKPGLKEYPDIHFSISHCKCFAACTISDVEIGIDAEQVGRTCKENVWRRMLSDVEYECILNMPQDERDRVFLMYWTLKESYGKAIGKGLSYDYKTVVFSLGIDSIICNVSDYMLWQTVVKRSNTEIIVSVCKKQNVFFKENIEWVKLIGGEAYET